MIFFKHACTAALASLLTLSAHAGAWGEGAFDNDAAQDFLAECTRSADAELVSRSIELALVASFVDADDGAAAVAAGEVIAGALGSSEAAPKPKVVPCLVATQREQLHALALRAVRAVERVADPAVSELAQQWAEEKPNRWSAGLRQLAARLRR
jgi:hypothetical protein